MAPPHTKSYSPFMRETMKSPPHGDGPLLISDGLMSTYNARPPHNTRMDNWLCASIS
jgi:hypothetical protein